LIEYRSCIWFTDARYSIRSWRYGTDAQYSTRKNCIWAYYSGVLKVNPVYGKMPVKSEFAQSRHAKTVSAKTVSGWTRLVYIEDRTFRLAVRALLQYSTVQYSTEGIGLVESESCIRQKACYNKGIYAIARRKNWYSIVQYSTVLNGILQSRDAKTGYDKQL
jgi:hypothetical protein